jgi:hypothetical protein
MHARMSRVARESRGSSCVTLEKARMKNSFMLPRNLDSLARLSIVSISDLSIVSFFCSRQITRSCLLRMTMAPRLYNGRAYVDVPEIQGGTPPPPMPDTDGSIFVSVASYRGALLRTIGAKKLCFVCVSSLSHLSQLTICLIRRGAVCRDAQVLVRKCRASGKGFCRAF